jgi:hypothetical protein
MQSLGDSQLTSTLEEKDISTNHSVERVFMSYKLTIIIYKWTQSPKGSTFAIKWLYSFDIHILKFVFHATATS